MPTFNTIVDLDSAARAAGTAVTFNELIAGSFKTFESVSALSSSMASAPDRFETDQIVYISASDQLFIISKSLDESFNAVLHSSSFSFPGSGGGSVSTGSLLTTASAALNVLTFTKGDGSTFNVTVDTGSGGGGGGTPGGSTTQIQFNDGGSFGGDPRFIFQKTTGLTQLSGSLQITGSSTSDIFIIKSASIDAFKVNTQGVLVLGEMASTPTAVEGGVYYSASQFYVGVE